MNNATSLPLATRTTNRSSYATVSVFAKKAAAKFEENETRDGFPTIQIQAAKCSSGNNTNDRYTWDTDKIQIQLTRNELPMVTAVLLGLIPEVKYEFRGKDRNKWFSIKLDDSGKHYLLALQEKSKDLRMIPILPHDAFYVANLCLRQLRRSQPWMTTGDLMISLKVIVGRLSHG